MAYHEIDGALFKDAPANDGKRHPLMHLALEVLGVKMQVAVWPAEKSAKGVQYWPCSGSYARGEARRLVPVDVAGMRIKYTDDVAAPGGGQPPAQGGPSASGGEDLPF